jgi:DNA invertase Pin-like site-specific DNA recombinase
MKRPPICYGYGRHSTNKQELTREVQEHRTVEYWERNLRDRGVLWGGFFYDAATSARIPFSERESGRQLHAVAIPGDHIVVTKLDRPFRSLRDGVLNMEQWHDRGINFHSMDLQVDTSTPMGRFFRTVILAVAELEREFARERTMETAMLRQKQGVPHSRGCPFGWKIVGVAPHRKYKADEEERTLIDQMASMREGGYSHDDIALWNYRQKLFPNKRIFPTRWQVRAALLARGMGYPKVTSYKKINRMARGQRT